MNPSYRDFSHSLRAQKSRSSSQTGARVSGWPVNLLAGGLVALLLPLFGADAEAQKRNRYPAHTDWNPETFEYLSGADEEEINEPELIGDERLDRIDSRLPSGTYNLNRLLGLEQFNALDAAIQKIDERQERLQALEGTGDNTDGDAGLDFSPEDEDDEEGDSRPEADDEEGNEEQFRVVSTGFLELDLEGQRVVSNDRSEVIVEGVRLEADRLIIDVPQKTIEAGGNVVFEDEESGTRLVGEALVFDFGAFTGRVWGAEGSQGTLRLLPNPERASTLPTFEQINERETIFTDASISTDNFPRPMYRIRGSELIFLRNQRFIVLHALFYVRDLPIFYFPVFSRSLGDPPLPWTLKIGNESGSDRELGFYAILSYDYYNSVIAPKVDNPDEFDIISQSRFTPFVFLATPAQGAGLEADYDFRQGTHRGEWLGFASPGHEDRKEAMIESEDQRWLLDLKHRTEITDNLDLLVNIDWVSDSEVYYDYLDETFFEQERGRVSERRALAAMTWTRDDYLARVKYEMKERLGRDRINNFQEPGDNDFDFDQFVEDGPLSFGVPTDDEGNPIEGGEPQLIDPSVNLVAEEDFFTDVDPEDEQIDRERFGIVTERQPEFNFTTSRIPIFTKPIYWTFDFRAFNNLDKGLNVVSESDDAFVRGFDAYNSLVNVVNFSDQYSWYNKVGVGIGRAERDSSTYGYFDNVGGLEFPEQPEGEGEDGEEVEPVEIDEESLVTLNNGLQFVDPETFLVGSDPTSIGDVEDQFFYYDWESIFNAEFSENLSGRLMYNYREGTDDHIGEFYERIGSRTSREDLFDFRLRKNRVEGEITYDFIYPALSFTLSGGHNLDGDDDLNANETINFVTLSGDWTSRSGEWNVGSSLSRSTTQIRDPSDEFAFESEVFVAVGQIDYFPVHERFWAQLEGNMFYDASPDDPAAEEFEAFIAESELDPDLGEERNRDDDLDFSIQAIYGFKVGPKYEVELQARYDEEEEDFDRIQLVFQRDLNDAVASLGFIWELEAIDDDGDEVMEDSELEGGGFDEGTEFERELSIEFGLGFKLPNRDRFSGPLATELIVSRRRAEIELGG